MVHSLQWHKTLRQRKYSLIWPFRSSLYMVHLIPKHLSSYRPRGFKSVCMWREREKWERDLAVIQSQALLLKRISIRGAAAHGNGNKETVHVFFFSSWEIPLVSCISFTGVFSRWWWAQSSVWEEETINFAVLYYLKVTECLNGFRESHSSSNTGGLDFCRRLGLIQYTPAAEIH